MTPRLQIITVQVSTSLVDGWLVINRFRTQQAKKRLFWIILLTLLVFSMVSVFPIIPTTHQALIINEFLASNSTGLLDEDGAHSDWIEIYNPGPSPIELAAWALTDDPNYPEKWQFPDS